MIPAKRTFYLLLGVNLLLIAGIVGVFILTGKIAAQKSKNIAITKADIDSNDQAITSIKNLQSNVNNNKEIEAIAAKVLPQDKEQTAVIAELNKFSQESGVVIRQITFTPSKGGNLAAPSALKGVSVLSANVRCDTAQYNDLLTLLKKIESNQRRMQVTSVALNPSDKVAGQLERIDLSIDIYLKS